MNASNDYNNDPIEQLLEGRTRDKILGPYKTTPKITHPNTSPKVKYPWTKKWTTMSNLA
jgi:hypothetical protein